MIDKKKDSDTEYNICNYLTTHINIEYMHTYINVNGQVKDITKMAFIVMFELNVVKY